MTMITRSKEKADVPYLIFAIVRAMSGICAITPTIEKSNSMYDPDFFLMVVINPE